MVAMGGMAQYLALRTQPVKQSTGLALYLAPGWHKTDMCGMYPAPEVEKLRGPGRAWP